MLRNGYVTWIVAMLVGLVTMLVIERAFRLGDPNQILPLAQAAGFWLAWVVAWPYMRTRPRWPWVNFPFYATGAFAVSTAIAALRIVLKTG